MDSKYPKIMAQWSLRAILVSLALASILLSSGCNEQSSSSSFGLEEEACPLPKYDRYGDYLSAQMVTNRSFGYGMFVCEFQAADAPVCSTFWLYANEPATKNLPDVAQNWRWNEIDFEFVPYTQATQSQYYTFNGGLPNPTVKAYGTTLNFGDPRAQSLANAAVTWTPGKFQTDETIAKDMWAYYNAFMAGGNNGGPSGGTFTLQDGQSGDTTNALSWSISAGDMQNALDGLNKGTGLFGLKGKYNVSIPAAGGPGDIQADSLNVIRNMDAGLVPQLAPGQIVTCVTNATIIPSGTTITGVDTSAKTVTLSQKATAAISRATFNFQASGVWAVNFTPAIESASALLIIDASKATPTDIMATSVPGYTDATQAQVNGIRLSIFQLKVIPVKSQTWWDLLVAETGDGQVWPNAQTWKYPLVHVPTPANLDIKKMVTLNFWRSPKGNESAQIDFGNWGTVTHTGILRERPIPGTAGHDTSFTSAVLNNEAYVFDTSGAFNPTQKIHTYTIVWTPTRMAQYIDAPDRGRDISHATPIAEYELADYQSLDHSGPQAEGGNIPWIGTELNQPIGQVTMNVANYVAFRAASTGPNNYVWATGNVSAGSTELTVTTPGLSLARLEGKALIGPGVPPGTSITAVDDKAKTVTMSAAASATYTAQCYTMGLDTVHGSTLNGSPVLSFPGVKDEDFAKIAVNQMVFGPGIPDGTSVKSIDDGANPKSVQLTAKATASGTNVLLVFQTSTSGAGWSGPAPGPDFTGANALVKSVRYYPLSHPATDGTANSDFNLDSPDKFDLDFSDGTWTADNFRSRISKYFSIIYAQDFTSEGAIPNVSPLRDAKSPWNVDFVNGTMRLRCTLSAKAAQRNFFVLQPQQLKDAEIGSGNPLVRAEIMSSTNSSQYYAASSSVTTPSAFFAPPKGESVNATVNVWVSTKGYFDPKSGTKDVPHDPAPDYNATLTLSQSVNGTVSWSKVSDPNNVVAGFQAANPHLITVTAPGK